MVPMSVTNLATKVIAPGQRRRPRSGARSPTSSEAFEVSIDDANLGRLLVTQLVERGK